MRLRYNRVLAAVMTSALLLTQSGFSVYAEAQDQVEYSEDAEAAGEKQASDENEVLSDTAVLTSSDETTDGEEKESGKEDTAAQETPDDTTQEPVQEAEPDTTAQTTVPETEAPAPVEEPVQVEPDTPAAPVITEPDTTAPTEAAPETQAQSDDGSSQEQTTVEPSAPQTEAAPASEAQNTQNEEKAETAEQTDDVIFDEEEDDFDDDEDELDGFDDGEDEEDEEETDRIAGMAVSFVTSADGATVRALLLGSESLPEDTKLQVERLDDASYKELLGSELNNGHREVSDVLAYRVSLVGEDGSDAGAGDIEVSFTYEMPVSLGLLPYMEASAAAYTVDDGVTYAGDLILEETEGEEPLLGSAAAQMKSGGVIVFAGVQNHAPKGEEITLDDIDRDLGDVLKYTIAANEFNTDGTVSLEDSMLFAVPDVAAANMLDISGAGHLLNTGDAAGEEDYTAGDGQEGYVGLDTGAGYNGAADWEGSVAADSADPSAAEDTGAGMDAEAGDLTLAPGDDYSPGEYALTGDLSADKIARRLELLSDLSLDLIDRKSSDDLTVVNVYADADGYVSYEPLAVVLYENGFDLDVTDTHIIVNIVADHEDQDLSLPVFAVQNTDPQLTSEDTWATYGRILYNLVALKDKEFVPYTGEAVMDYATGGTWLAPEGTLVVKNALVGAAYADKVLAAPDAVFAKTAFAAYDTLPDGMGTENGSTGKADFEMDAEQEAMIAANAQPSFEEVPEAETEAPVEETEFTDAEEETEASLTAALNEDDKILEEEEEEPAQEENADPEKDFSNAISTAKFGVQAVNEDSNAMTVTFQLFDANGSPLKTATSDSKAIAEFDLEKTDTDKIFSKELGTVEEVTLKVTPITIPDGYYPDKTEIEVTIRRDVNGDVTFQKLNSEGVKEKADEALYNAGTFTYIPAAFVLNVSSLLSTDKETSVPAEFEIHDSEGNVLKDPKNSKKNLTIPVDEDGPAEVAIDMSGYSAFQKLATNKPMKLTLVQTTESQGYVGISSDKIFYIAKDSHGKLGVKKETASKFHYGSLSYTFYQRPLKATIKVSAVDKDDDSKKPLSGATYVIRMPDGSMLSGSDGRIHTTKTSKSTDSSGKTVTTVKEASYVLDLTKLSKLAKVLADEGKVTLTISELTPPTGTNTGKAANYDIYGSADYTVTLEVDEETKKLTATPSTIYMLNEKRSSSTSTSDSVRVTKSLLYDGNTIYFSDLTKYYESLNASTKDKISFYVALFSDKKKTNRVSEVREISFKAGLPTASTTFSNLEAGTYYVGEVDRYGNLVGTKKKKKNATDPFYVTYDSAKVKVSGTTSATIDVSMMNNYFDEPEGISYYAYVTVQKIYKNKSGQEENSDKEFYFLLRRWSGNEYSWIGSTSSPHVIKMDGNSRAEITLPVSMASAKTSEISAVEVELDSDGAVQRTSDGAIKAVSTWTVSYSDTSVTLKRNQKTIPVITITNQEKDQTQSETSSNQSESNKNKAGTVSLTLTKKVTYKGAAQAVNGAYYIGIFKSATLSKDNLLTPVKALALRNAAQASRDPMTINLSSSTVQNGQITLYFAETDKDGNPVKSGDSTGYNISINGQAGNSYSYTFTGDTPNVEVAVTNDIIAGGIQEKRLLNASSGFAGDTSAYQAASERASSTDTGTGTGTAAGTGTGAAAAAGNGTAAASATGDSSPILPLLAIFGCSAVVIAAVLIFMFRRRRR